MKNNRNESQYKAQIKHLQKNYKHFHIDFKFDIYEKFQNTCKKNNTTPTTEIKKFVRNYIENNKNMS